MLLKLNYVQDIENLMVGYEYYIQDILESTKTTTLYLQRAKMEEVSHYSLRPEHVRCNVLHATRFEGCNDCARRLLPGCSKKNRGSPRFHAARPKKSKSNETPKNAGANV